MDYQQYIKDRSKEIDGCWIWQQKLTEKGYGACLSNDPRKHAESSHRVSYRAFKGAIPEFGAITHTCDNKDCVNPAHLELFKYEAEETIIKNDVICSV